MVISCISENISYIAFLHWLLQKRWKSKLSPFFLSSVCQKRIKLYTKIIVVHLAGPLISLTESMYLICLMNLCVCIHLAALSEHIWNNILIPSTVSHIQSDIQSNIQSARKSKGAENLPQRQTDQRKTEISGKHTRESSAEKLVKKSTKTVLFIIFFIAERQIHQSTENTPKNTQIYKSALFKFHFYYSDKKFLNFFPFTFFFNFSASFLMRDCAMLILLVVGRWGSFSRFFGSFILIWLRWCVFAFLLANCNVMNLDESGCFFQQNCFLVEIMIKI